MVATAALLVAATTALVVNAQVAHGSSPRPLIIVPPCCGGSSIATDVSPNSGLYFSSSTNGVWIAGQDPDVNAIGETGAGASTPGDAIDVTTDGGHTWTNALSDSNGLFGLDFVNANVGWAPGALGLYQTTDGGSTWTAISAANGNPLIQVDFSSTESGFGIDQSGQVWTTTNGGASWTQYNNLPPTASLCFGSSAIFAAELNGTIQASTDSGATWHNSYTFEGAASGVDSPAYLECNGSNVNVDFSPQTGNSSGIQFEDIETQDGGNTWSVVENTISGITDGVTSTSDSAEGPQFLQSTGSLADVTYQTGFGAISLNTYSGNPPTLANQTAVSLTSTNLPNASISDAMSWSSSPVYSITFANSQDGWLAASLTSDANGTFASVIYSTTDGGVTWSPVFSTPIYFF